MRQPRFFPIGRAAAIASFLAGCPAGDAGLPAGSGGAGPATGGSVGTGGRGTGGSASGGSASGGSASGGSASGGSASGGSASGGVIGTGGGGGSGTGGATGGSNGTGGTAGRGGASGGTGGGGGATAAGCASATGWLFCDDFETATVAMPPPSAKWATSFNGSATITVDGTTPARSGTKSVHVKTAGSYQAFFVLGSGVTFPARAYVRVYMRLGAPMTGGHNTYFKSGAAATTSSEHETRVGVMNGMLMINQPAGDRGFLSNQNYYTDGNKPGVVFAPLTWVCVELLVDPPKSEIDMWVDGKEVPDLHRTDWQQDAVGALRFGFEKYAGPDVDIWYDDVAVGTQQIGCN